MFCRVARFFLVCDTKTGKMYKTTQNVPSGHKIFQMAIKYSKWPQNISTFSNLKNYPNWDLWFENKPSGNPAVLLAEIQSLLVLSYFKIVFDD
jgi:hypothetical protein